MPPGRRQRSSQTRTRATCSWCARVRPEPARATMTEPIVLTPIGVVRGGRSQIYEDHWGAVVARLVLDPAVLDPAVLDQAATDELSEFSHIEVVFHFHQETRVRRGATHPRGNPAWPQAGLPRRTLAGPPEPPRRLRLRPAGGRRPRTDSAGSRRHRRNPDPGHQAVRGRVPAGRPSARACLDAREDKPAGASSGDHTHCPPGLRPAAQHVARRRPTYVIVPDDPLAEVAPRGRRCGRCLPGRAGRPGSSRPPAC